MSTNNSLPKSHEELIQLKAQIRKEILEELKAEMRTDLVHLAKCMNEMAKRAQRGQTPVVDAFSDPNTTKNYESPFQGLKEKLRDLNNTLDRIKKNFD